VWGGRISNSRELYDCNCILRDCNSETAVPCAFGAVCGSDADHCNIACSETSGIFHVGLGQGEDMKVPREGRADARAR